MRDTGSVVGFGEDQGNTVLSNAREEKIFVSIRVRPLNERERARRDASEWECISSNTIRFKSNVVAEQRSMPMDTYTFDRVFGERCSTKQVYEQGIKEVALSVVNGINCSIFAYGQTSSGKTYTMTRITDYAVRDIYEHIEKHKEREFILKFSAMEIYNEAVRDLLSANATALRLLDDPEKGTVVEKLAEETLTESGQLQQLLAICAAERTTEETAMNETSSRSHQILRLTVESNPSYVDTARSGTLTASVNFVDLAGSERAAQTLSAGTRLREGSHINRSLLTLGTVIRKLSKGRNGHIPYRDSKLTRILHNSLGGNARTAIICTISPARSQVEQSRNTLFFAGCAKQVATNAQVNLVMSDKVLVKQLQRELARMENELRKFTPNTTLLKERELQIEQMNKKIQELTQQRDLFQSHVENLLQSVGKDKLSSKDKDRALESSGVTNNIPLGTDSPRDNLHSTKSSVSISNEQVLHQSENSEDYFLLDGNPPSFVEPDPCQDWASESSGVDNNIHPGIDTISENLDGTSRVSISNEHLLQQPENPEDYFLLDDSSPTFVGPDPCQGWEEMTSRAKTVDNCKEVPCIEIKEMETDHEADSNTSLPVSSETETGGKSPLIQIVNIDAVSSSGNGHSDLADLSKVAIDNSQDGLQQKTEDLQRTSNLLVDFSEKFNESSESEPHVLAVVSPPHIDNMDQDTSSLPPVNKLEQNASPSRFDKMDQEPVSPPQLDEPELKTILPPQCDDPEQALKHNASPSLLNKLDQGPSSPPQFDEQELKTMSPPQFDEQELKTISPPQFDELEQESVSFTPGAEREYYNSLVSFHDKLSESKLHSKKRNSSRTCSLVQEMHASVEDVESVLDSETEDTASVLNFVVRMKARGKPKSFNEDLGDFMVHAKTPGLSKQGNRVKGISFHGVSGPLMPSKYERQQRDIIELWDACNVPLVHRTYFFLLIKGELSDSVYLDVELRRLSFLKDTFSTGNHITGEEGQDITPNSSLMSLNRERKMLSKQVHKKFSRKEREELYLKWGINLKSKHRNIQLAWLLWTNSKDLDHVRESAALVAKLVGFINSAETPKRTFGLSFFHRKSHNWKETTSTLL